jgi:hypothetical protein
MRRFIVLDYANFLGINPGNDRVTNEWLNFEIQAKFDVGQNPERVEGDMDTS